MIGRAIFLGSIFKGLNAYPKPLFWALIYLGYLFGAEYLWALMLNHWKAPILYGALGLASSYAIFRGMKEVQDGLLYWALLAGGFFVLIAVLP